MPAPDIFSQEHAATRAGRLASDRLGRMQSLSVDAGPVLAG
jgi:hypothetical protein